MKAGAEIRGYGANFLSKNSPSSWFQNAHVSNERFKSSIFSCNFFATHFSGKASGGSNDFVKSVPCVDAGSGGSSREMHILDGVASRKNSLVNVDSQI